ncbi:MAG TPA: hypothetical protein VNT04_08955, partial [Gaiellaceae bacterium]|nr:hypothetical protein [Gaiellaceae bacterium]
MRNVRRGRRFPNEAWATLLAETGESADRVRFYCDYLFDEIPLQGKTMLDVGAGDGRYSFYAACA